MSYSRFDDEALRQYPVSSTHFLTFQQAQAAARQVTDELRWVDGPEGQCLHRLDESGRKLHDFGLRNPELEQIYDRHCLKQQAATENLALAEDGLRKAQAFNRAIGFGRVPNVVVGVLNALARRDLGKYYRVIGTHALYAYEMHAGVFFDQGTTTTNDVDLLWNVDQRMHVVSCLGDPVESMIEILQQVDASFERSELNKESAINADVFAVDFLRREDPDRSYGSYSFSGVEGDVYPAPAERSSEFLTSPRFDQVVIAVNGEMAIMPTVRPQVFVDFKLWMSKSAKRDADKRVRDKRQAESVQELIDLGLLPGG